MKSIKIFIRTFGCTLNQSDSEVMAGLLVEAGFELVDSVEPADLVLFNTCTVKDSPEKRFFSELKKVQHDKKMIVVAGCIPQSDKDNIMLSDISLIGVNNIIDIVEVVKRTSKGEIIKLLDNKGKKRLNLIKIRRNPVVEIIPICAGCLGNCSFCKTKFARGNLVSYPIKEIKRQFESAVNDGVKEIWLTSQDNGAFGKDIDSNLPILLNNLLSIKGKYMVRIGMINPNHALEFVDDFIKVLNHPNVFKFVHFPVQSGSDKVLKDMNRKYFVNDFIDLIFSLRKGVPNITISTDIIAGFPTETDDDFNETYNLLRKLKIPVINITKFFARPGTIAKKLKPLANSVAKNRTSALAKLQKEIISNSEWLGWKGRIIIDEKGKNDSWVGRNDYYKPVVVRGDFTLGEVLEVKVFNVEQFYLEGEII